MTIEEKELIGKIRKLRQIKPDKDWVVLVKSQILGEDLAYRERVSVNFFPFWKPFFKPAFATITSFGLLFGIFAFGQNALPGDLLYPVKKLTEKTQAVFISEEEKPSFQLKLTNERLEELTKIAETHQAKKLAPAIKEYQANVSEAAKNLTQIKKPQQTIEAGKGIAIEIKKLDGNKQKVESLGVVLPPKESDELDNAIAILVEREIKGLEDKTLTVAQQEILQAAIKDFEAGNYNSAFEKIFILSYE